MTEPTTKNVKDYILQAMVKIILMTKHETRQTSIYNYNNYKNNECNVEPSIF